MINLYLKVILLLLGFIFIHSCEKEKDDECKKFEVYRGHCTWSDTALAYQYLLGKWYLNTLSISGPLSHETKYTCYHDDDNYLEFLPSRHIVIRGAIYWVGPDTFRDTTIVWDLRADSTWYSHLKNNPPIMGSSQQREITSCENVIQIGSTSGPHYTYHFTRKL